MPDACRKIIQLFSYSVVFCAPLKWGEKFNPLYIEKYFSIYKGLSLYYPKQTRKKSTE